MADRRARKKLETREKILEAAYKLFNAKGLADTTMGEVALAADVGVGTLYNYFKSKELLLLGVFQDTTEELIAEGREIVNAPGDDPVEAVCRLLGVYQHLSTLFDKHVMREMLAASLVQPASLEDYASLDMQLAGQVGELVASFQERGMVAADVEIETAAIALYGALLLPFMLFLSMDGVDAATLDSMVRRQVRTVFDGLAPRKGDGT